MVPPLTQIGQSHMAIEAYRRVLAAQLPEQDMFPATTVVSSAIHGSEVPPSLALPPQCFDLRREAAWNLMLILKQSGSVTLAQQICDRYLTLD